MRVIEVISGYEVILVVGCETVLGCGAICRGFMMFIVLINLLLFFLFHFHVSPARCRFQADLHRLVPTPEEAGCHNEKYHNEDACEEESINAGLALNLNLNCVYLRVIVEDDHVIHCSTGNLCNCGDDTEEVDSLVIFEVEFERERLGSGLKVH